MQTISATALARNTRKILDQVTTRGEAVAVERHDVLIARIVPAEPTMTAAEALAVFAPRLPAKSAAAWLKDSRHRFDETVRDPWE
jgi:antitoxin (DNA-binding transcriptional repressor) of toxin-antitoxin stability system